VYLNPDENLLEHYIYEERVSIIVKPLVTKTPLEKEQKISTPSIKKILVDIFVDRKLFSAFQGSELVHIFNTLYSTYTKRRTKDQETRLAYKDNFSTNGNPLLVENLMSSGKRTFSRHIRTSLLYQ